MVDKEQNTLTDGENLINAKQFTLNWPLMLARSLYVVQIYFFYKLFTVTDLHT